MPNKTLHKIIEFLFRITWDSHCPACGQDMPRIKRTKIYKLISKTMPVTRHTCCGHNYTVRDYY
ncbi:MAG: hypothetical protein WD267_03915 [Balneolales bacterium]